MPAPPAEPPAPAVTDGRGVLGAMHARYASDFYSTLTFKQNTTTLTATGRELKGVWNEVLAVPGRLRIDYQPLTSHSGVLYANGRIHAFTDGKAQPAQRGWNPLAILIADVYAQPVDTTVRQLDSLGFDLSVMREDTWQGRAAWVVGARAGDTTHAQFWVDRDSLLVRRVIQRDVRGTRPVVTDVRFYRYQSVGGYPVAFDVHFHRDGRLYFKEEYFDVRVNEPVAPELFDPARWVAAPVKR